MIPVKLAEPIPLFVSVSDEAIDYVVRARIFTLNPYAEIAAAQALALVADSPGYYSSSDVPMPNHANVHAVFSIYEADGTTLVAKAEEVYSLQEVDRIDGEEVLAVIDDDVIIGEIICD